MQDLLCNALSAGGGRFVLQHIFLDRGGGGPNRYSRFCFSRGFVDVKTFINVLETEGPLDLT